MKSIIKTILAAAFATLTAAAAAQSKQIETAAGTAEAVTWPSLLCLNQPQFHCQAMNGSGQLFRETGQNKIVMISHGSQGVDARMYDYVKHLRKAGFAALIIDHWSPRGIGRSDADYVAAAAKGANEINMTSDSLTAADWLRGQGFTKVGSIGESQGGQAVIGLTQKWEYEIVDRFVSRIYSRQFKARPLNAVIGMYGFCGFRNLNRDGYHNTPFLFITGEVDDETPSKYCEAYVPYMNERGGNASIVVLEGEGHSFDAPFKRQRNLFSPHYAKCNIVVEKDRVVELNTGDSIPGIDSAPMFAKCVSRIYHSGYWTNRDVAVPTWISFFKQHLGSNV